MKTKHKDGKKYQLKEIKEFANDVTVIPLKNEIHFNGMSLYTFKGVFQ